MDGDTAFNLGTLLRDHSWLLILGVMFVIVIIRFATGAVRSGNGKPKAEDKTPGHRPPGNREDPDSLPDLTSNIRKTRVQVILAGLIVLLTFILFTVLRNFNS